ncbi:adenylate/guanylate cyclase domain-containing protein [Shewanella sp. NKUCC01_JLK]|uniref:nucleotide-binding domain-containing protein n=1 Tax=Shewanella sp. NKUCC01_JLK TaxID=2842123 RepID=UPI001C5BCE5A|nr:adenylate/guanylate cyclase domain-containing protein [Shewanella sp. NKUCC01_JLK]MBW3513214.1 adenylate/guanylate cyclase domain-containing protein [Shewanella sp. NKUCC01_JLK]
MRDNQFKQLFENELTRSKYKYASKNAGRNVAYNRNQLFESISEDSKIVEKGIIKTAGLESLPLDIQEEFIAQKYIRNLFGKEGVNCAEIGFHPDFSSLQYDDSTINQYICTIFFDIKGSTRLSLVYELEEVFQIKNAILKVAIETIRAFDGYVHRLMGDAVMAFFGSSSKAKEDAIIDAVNSCVTLKMFMEKGIKPNLKGKGFDTSDFGFRVGCDFGKDNEVLWGAYGFDSVGEISPTGLPVDMASKLQGLADDNSVMLGQGLLDFIVWPDIYSLSKFSEGEEVRYVIPNITGKDDNFLNYRMKILDYEKILTLSAWPIKEKSNENTIVEGAEHVDFKCYVNENNDKKEYISASRCLNKGLDLEFSVSVSKAAPFIFPIKLSLYKQNNGPYVSRSEKVGAETVSLSKTIYKSMSSLVGNNEPYSFLVPEKTAYRGLHTMRCVLEDANGKIVYENSIGVFIN